MKPVPLHVLQRIMPAPLHAVHSRGDRLVKPRPLSSFLSRCEIFTGASRLPVPSQKMHVSPPLCAHAHKPTRAHAPTRRTRRVRAHDAGFLAASQRARRRTRLARGLLPSMPDTLTSTD